MGKKKRKGGKNTTATLFKLVRLGALVAPAAYIAVQPWDTKFKVRIGMKRYTGFDIETGEWHAGDLLKGWGPYLGAVVATYGIPKIAGIIRRL